MRFRKAPALHVFLTLTILLYAAMGAHAQTVNDRRSAVARDMATNFAHLGIHELYLPDSGDTNGRPHGPNALFAGRFSQLLQPNARGFALLPRHDVHRFLPRPERAAISC